MQLRRERGLTSGGDFRLPLVALNRLILQSGLTHRLAAARARRIGMVAAFARDADLRHSLVEAAVAAVVARRCCPTSRCACCAAGGRRNSARSFPTRIDIIVRSLRAGHPVPIAITMVAREMPDPIGSEFGIVADEITYGADLETAMRNLYFRVGPDDLPLFVTAVAIQGSTGGNLGEILENLSAVIRQRFKMRRKIKALAAEGRASAMILSSLPIGMFFVIHFIVARFLRQRLAPDLTKVWLGAGRPAGCCSAISSCSAWSISGSEPWTHRLRFQSSATAPV